MMNSCSNSKEQRLYKLNECFLVADRIREAGRCELQGVGKLRNSKWNPNGGGDITSTSLTSSTWDIASAKKFLALPVQGSGALLLEPNFFHPGNFHSEKKSSAN
jgi:hypothetical protein